MAVILQKLEGPKLQFKEEPNIVSFMLIQNHDFNCGSWNLSYKRYKKCTNMAVKRKLYYYLTTIQQEKNQVRKH